MKTQVLAYSLGKGSVISYSGSSFYTASIREIIKNIKNATNLQAFQKNPVESKGTDV